MSVRWVRWADAVFHVLAHVRASAGVAASVHDPAYVAFAERRLGRAADRALGEDAEHLGRLVSEHAELARLQLLAWLFDEPEQATALGGRALSELGEHEVSDPSARPHGAAAEILWCAVLLEIEAFSKLPAPVLDAPELDARIRENRIVAPALASAELGVARALAKRGRVRKSAIWVGVPNAELGVSLDHVAWQASHEATVSELWDRAAALPIAERASERELEHAAVVLLAERARAAGLAREHAEWFAHFGGRAPSPHPEALPARARSLL